MNIMKDYKIYDKLGEFGAVRLIVHASLHGI